MKKTRREAIDALEKYYDTRKSCKHGHTSKRNTADGSCVSCRIESSAKQAEQNKNIRAMLNEASKN